MLKEMIIVVFLTALLIGLLTTIMGISDEGRTILGIFNGLFWGRYFYNKYYASKNDKGDKNVQQ